MKGLIQKTIPILMALAIAGCGQPPTADQVVQRMQNAMDTFDQGHALIEVTAQHEGETKRLLAESWADREGQDLDRARVEIREASHPDMVGALAVSDGQTGWLYHPDEAKALTGGRDALEAWREQHQGDETPMADIESLREAIDELLRISTITLVGEAQIAGRDAWHLSLTPNENAPQAWQVAGGTAELWVDQATDLPLQARYSGSATEAGEVQVSVRQLDLENPIDPALFAWTPPAGTEIVNVIDLLPKRLTLPQAVSQAPFTLLTTPGDESKATLVEVLVQGDFYTQRFDGTAGQWTLTQGQPDAKHTHDAEQHADKRDDKRADRPEVATTQTTVRGQPATLRQNTEKGMVSLRWTENGVVFTLAGQLSPDAAQAFAESLVVAP